MQFGKDAALRLLIVDDTVEAAEAVVSTLRNAGIAVRPSRPENADELAHQITQQSPDLVLVGRDAKLVPASLVLQNVGTSGKDLPVLLLVDTIDEAGLLDALSLGARGIVLRHRNDHIVTTVRTEWADLDARRALRKLEFQVRETERRCDALIESSRDPIAYLHEGMHIRANSAYLEMFGYESFDEVEGMSLLDMIAPSHVEPFKALLKKLSKGEPPPPRVEVEARTLDGNQFPAVMEFTPAMYEGEHCLQLVLRRQELDPDLAREVEELRQRDQATGLLNRPTFLRALEDAIADAAQNSTHSGFLLIEPDYYARLLQDIGLDAADDLVAACARRLRDSVSEDVVLARFGEHQFAALARGASHEVTQLMAEQIRTAFAEHVIEVGNRSLNATVSIGGVQVGEKIASVTAVLARATQGVQSCVGMGGNRVEIFDPGAADRAEEERVQAWVDRIRDALDSDRFTMAYQPLVSLHGEPGEIYEAYLRMKGDQGELVAPLAFLQIAEENGLLWEIDRWVVGSALQVIGERMAAGKRTTLLVKITESSLQDDSLLKHIEEQISRHGADGSLLVVQLPESKVFTNLRAAQEFQARAARSGVRVGLEHFGAGLNSFQLLAHFDADFLKIDRTFMEQLGTSTEHQQRLRDITDKARALGKRTIAEHVRDAQSMTVLFGAGVDYAQGFFLAGVSTAMDYEFG
jgi:diguanylate cyclase (GGDEF)-like protein/PAS domain S-box-containing protein